MSQTSRMWCLDTLSSIVGTVIGIILTFGVTFWIEYRNKIEDNKRATLIVLENVTMIYSQCKEFYKNVEYSAPILEGLMQLTSEDVKRMPEDSVNYYLAGFNIPGLYVYQDFARNLINTNFDILRNTDNYTFLFEVHSFYNLYDNYKILCETSGPHKLLEDINKELFETSLQMNTLDYSWRFVLLQVVESLKCHTYIRTYLDDFVHNVKEYMEYMKITIEKIVKLSKFSYEDYAKYLKESPKGDEIPESIEE